MNSTYNDTIQSPHPTLHCLKVKEMQSKVLLKLYTLMLKIRLAEEAVAECYLKQEITMYIHLYIGQEAIATGICMHLKKGDFIFSNHRSHGHFVARGGGLKPLFSELFGRLTGCSKGKGGSMHLVDAAKGYMGSSSIVAGNIPISVGCALAFKLSGTRNIAVSFFGDGAVDEGVFYESLNFAALKNLPVLFVCENNFYAICSHQLKRQSSDNIFEKARVFGVSSKRLDGNDVLKIYTEAGKIIKGMREGGGPYLLECRTYRWMGHAGPKEDWELGYRTKEELNYYKTRCPIKRLEKLLFKKKILNEHLRLKIRASILKEIEEAKTFARKSPWPKRSHLLKDVFSKRRISL